MTSALPVVTARLRGGTRAIQVPWLRLVLPDRAGLLLARWPGAPDVDRAGSVLVRRSRAVVAQGAGVSFMEVHREPVRVAVTMARLAHVRSVVVCPVGVSPGRTSLAVAVADLLRQRRPGGQPVVTCAQRPPLGAGQTAVPHEVRVDVAGEAQDRIVWEILAWEQVPGWLVSLRTSVTAGPH
jgi:hypothetical protein